jgi:hypothetical protein
MAIAMGVLFAGCGKTDNSADTANKETGGNAEESTVAQKDEESKDDIDIGEIKDLGDYFAAQQKIGEAYDENDPEAAAKMMESYVQLEGQMALDEFEKLESLDAPSDFPSGLIYNKGKITSSSDDSYEGYINKNITIETTDSLKTVKDFYKNLFSQSTWTITSQSSESDGASFEATDAAAIDASVSINADSYSKIASISILYSGDITE